MDRHAQRWARSTARAAAYASEALALGLFMVSAGTFGVVLEAPGSPLRAALPDPTLRRGLMGILMGLTATILTYSPLGRCSGAHMNPALTLAFLSMRTIKPADAIGYIIAQCSGGLAGILLVWLVFGEALSNPPVAFVATTPGVFGTTAAFAGEFVLSFLLMLLVLTCRSSVRYRDYTGFVAGLFVALAILSEAPLSGMSMNPARSFASAAPAAMWSSFWIYLTAPTLGMLLAPRLRRLVVLRPTRPCPKLAHSPSHRCLFCGDFHE